LGGAAGSASPPSAGSAVTGTRLKAGVALLLTAGLLAAGAGLLGHQEAPPQQPGAQPAPAAAGPARPDAAEGNPVPVDRHGDPLPDGALLRFGTVRFRHSGGAHAIALSPDGKTLVTEGEDAVRLWDAVTAKPGPVLRLRGSHQGAAQNLLAFSPDGQRLFFTQRGGVAARDLATGQTDVVWPVRPATVIHSVHPSPDGRLLAVGTSEGALVVELASGRLLWRSRKRPTFLSSRDDRLLLNGPYSLALFAPDGKLVAINASDAPKVLLLQDPASGEERRRIDLGALVVRLAFSPDGHQVAVTERDNAVRVYDVGTGERLHSWTVKLTDPSENYTSAVAFSPDGATLAAGATDNLIHRWDLRTGRELAPLRGHTWYVLGLIFSADGRWLYSVGWDGAIRRWDTGTGQEKAIVPGAATGTVARSPVGSLLAWEGEGGVLHFADAVTGKTVRTLPGNPAGFAHLAFSPDGSILAAGGNDLSLQLWEVATGKLLRQWSWPKGKDPHTGVEDIAFSPDGKTLATASFRGHEVLLWDVSTGARLARAPQEMVYGVVFTPDGQTLVSAGWDRGLRWWDVPGLRPRDAVVLPNEFGVAAPFSDPRLHAVACSPDGRLLATINLGGGVSVWDARDRKRLHSFQAVGGQCNLTFSPDGQWLSTGGYDGDVAVWEARSGQRVLKLAGHPARVFSVAFGPDGRTLVTGSNDCTALVWDLRPRAEAGDDPDMAALWDALGGSDAPAAYRAVWSLADRPDRSVPFLKGKLKAAQPPDPKRLRELFDRLDNDRFAEREAASKELAAVADAVEPELRRELTQAPSVEKRRRLQTLLDGLGPGTSEDARRARAVIVLQWAKTPEARTLLEELVGGAPGARLTREAKAALERLER
jgi:WD40 repeat protein